MIHIFGNGGMIPIYLWNGWHTLDGDFLVFSMGQVVRHGFYMLQNYVCGVGYNVQILCL